MRVAVFSDIHGNLQALNAILDHIKNNNIDKTIFLGDAIGLGPSSNECLKVLNKLKDCIFIAGNHEIYYTRKIELSKEEHEIIHNRWIHKILKEKVDDSLLSYELNINNKKYLFIHYFLKDDIYPFEGSSVFKDNRLKDVVKNIDADYVFYGHIHAGRYDEVDNKKLYCIGSSGCRDDDNTFYYVIDSKDDSISKVDVKYDREEFEKTLFSYDYPDRDHISKRFFGIKKC